MNGKPHKAAFANSRHEVATGNWIERLPIHRRSCLCICVWINLPAQMNSRDLNSAWATM